MTLSMLRPYFSSLCSSLVWTLGKAWFGKLSWFDISSSIVSGESKFLKIWNLLLQGCSNYFVWAKGIPAVQFGTDNLYTLCNGGLPCGIFCPLFKVSASKCIFSYAPKISKDLLAKKNHLNSRTRPQAFKGSVKIPMIPWYWAGFLIALKYQGKVWVDHTLFSLWYTHLCRGTTYKTRFVFLLCWPSRSKIQRTQS